MNDISIRVVSLNVQENDRTGIIVSLLACHNAYLTVLFLFATGAEWETGG